MRWQLETHKTKALRCGARQAELRSKSALLVSHGENRNLELASRNLEGVKLAAPNVLQPYDVLKHDLLVLSKDAVARLSHTLDPEKRPVVVPDVETIAPAADSGEERSSAEGQRRKKPAAAKKAAKAGQEKGEGISHVSPSLSDYSPADHHGKRTGREGNAAHRGV